jgi:MGT family glycosyltransferase
VGRDEPDNPGPLPALFDRLNGRPLVYVSLGSVINRNKDFFRMIVEAFAGRREAVLISTGNGVDPAEFGELPDNVAIEAWVPQSQVLKRASLFITHGGLNSVHDGLLFGLPMLFVPQQEEQTLNGGRAVELGAGLMLRRREVSPERILSMAERLLAEPAFKENACRLGETLRTAGGVKTAADEIELIAQASRARYNSSGP